MAKSQKGSETNKSNITKLSIDLIEPDPNQIRQVHLSTFTEDEIRIEFINKFYKDKKPYDGFTKNLKKEIGDYNKDDDIQKIKEDITNQLNTLIENEKLWDAGFKINNKKLYPLTKEFIKENPEKKKNKEQFIRTNRLILENYYPNEIIKSKTETIKELANSIKNVGLINPITIKKKKDDDNTYIIIAGERRFRAAKEAGLKEVPVVIIEKPDAICELIQLEENLHRVDLTAIEEAEAYINLKEKYPQNKIADKFGKSKSYISRMNKIESINTDLRNKIRGTDVSKEVLFLLSDQSKKDQKTLWDKIKNKPTLKSLKTEIKKLENKNKKTDDEEKPEAEKILKLLEKLSKDTDNLDKFYKCINLKEVKKLLHEKNK